MRRWKHDFCKSLWETDHPLSVILAISVRVRLSKNCDLNCGLREADLLPHPGNQFRDT